MEARGITVLVGDDPGGRAGGTPIPGMRAMRVCSASCGSEAQFMRDSILKLHFLKEKQELTLCYMYTLLEQVIYWETL